MNIRLIDFGEVSWLQSQTIYHALAYAKKESTPDTIVFAVPVDSYVCIGFHRDLEREIDIEFCLANEIPVFRRETGGGTVYIDDEQLFTQWIFAPKNLPKRVDERFKLFIKPTIETYKFFGIDAAFFPPNDVHIKGRKIVGTGAAHIGNAEVVTGNFLFDFDCEMMAKILKVPSENFREIVYDSLLKFMTTMKRELGTVPDKEELKAVYIQECEKILGRKIVVGSLTDEEYEMMAELDKKFVTKEWLYQYKTKNNGKRLVKIHANVWLYETIYKTDSHSIHISLRVKGKRIDTISIRGDFVFNPPTRLRGLERILRNVELSPIPLQEVIEAYCEMHRIEISRATIYYLIQAILQIKKSHPTAPFAV